MPSVWEFWVAAFYNVRRPTSPAVGADNLVQFFTAAWGAYATSMISEVVPAPKAYMFFALFNTVGKTSGFIGPFISSAIISRAGGDTNASFWFLFAMGSVSSYRLCEGVYRLILI